VKLGTKSVLYGAHCFLLHPWFVALAWWRLFGFPLDPRLWVAFFVHDLGYVGKPNMDGEEGELHPYWGACVMGALFGRRWFEFTLAHSRFLAKRLGIQPSRLCIADKLATPITPRWLYLPLVRATGEIHEYMAKSSSMNATGNKYSGMNLDISSQQSWYRDMTGYMRRWVEEHRDGRADTWTPAASPANAGRAKARREA
jgi:hypothetical protein